MGKISFCSFQNLIKYISWKDFPFVRRKDPRNDSCTIWKKWRRSPLFKGMFLLNSVGFIPRFHRTYPRHHPCIICGYLKFQFNHRNIKFKYIYRFTFGHLCYIDELIFSLSKNMLHLISEYAHTGSIIYDCYFRLYNAKS